MAGKRPYLQAEYEPTACSQQAKQSAFWAPSRFVWWRDGEFLHLKGNDKCQQFLSETDDCTRSNTKNCSLEGSDQRLGKPFSEERWCSPRTGHQRGDGWQLLEVFHPTHVSSDTLALWVIKYPDKKFLTRYWRNHGSLARNQPVKFSETPVQFFQTPKCLYKPHHNLPDNQAARSVSPQHSGASFTHKPSYFIPADCSLWTQT